MSRRDFSLLLPGRWWTLELGGEQRLRADIRRYLQAVGGRRDDQTLMRAEVRRRLFRAACDAREAGGTHQFFGIEVAPGVPFPAVLTVSWPPVRMPRPDAEPVALRDAVVPDEASAVAFPIGSCPAVRTHRRIRRPALEERGAPEVETLVADFWVGLPESGHVALFSASVPMVAEEEELLDLFTVVMTSLQWLPPGGGSGAAAPVAVG